MNRINTLVPTLQRGNACIGAPAPSQEKILDAGASVHAFPRWSAHLYTELFNYFIYYVFLIFCRVGRVKRNPPFLRDRWVSLTLYPPYKKLVYKGVRWSVGTRVIKYFFISFLFMSTAAQSFTVTPKNIISKPNQTHIFKVIGGLPPIYWQSRAGEVERGSEANSFIYRAPRRYMQDYVRFFDRVDQSVQVDIEILRPLRASPSRRNIPINGKTRFRIMGASGNWKVKPDKNLKFTQHNKILYVKATTVVGLRKIEVYDEVTKEEIELEVRVYAPLELLN